MSSIRSLITVILVSLLVSVGCACNKDNNKGGDDNTKGGDKDPGSDSKKSDPMPAEPTNGPEGGGMK